MTLLFNQALQAHQNGRISEAEELYRKIISADPKNFDALHMLGIVCSGNGKNQDADKFFRAAVAIDPGFPPCHVNYGFYLLKQKRLDEAVASFDQALALFPNFAEAWLGRGNALRELRRVNDAFAAYGKAIALRPNLAEAHAGSGNMLSGLQRYDEAIIAYDKALTLNPNLEFVESERFHCKLRICDWKNYSAERQHLLAGAKDNKIQSQPFEFLNISSSPREQLACAKSWVAKKYPESDTPMWRGEIYKHDRIRVAYVSADFREHATSHLTAGMFESHDKSRFEITAIAFGADDKSEMRERLKNSFEQFIDAETWKDDKIASTIKDAQIDILIDLKGFTQNARTGIFARRPAPIQVNYLGYPGTMGADYIDYLIADQAVVPQSHQADFAEKLVYLPNSYQVNDTKRTISEKSLTRAEYGLPEMAFVFCSFNNSYKIVPHMFDSWMRILERATNSVLWLLEDNAKAVLNLKREAESRGIRPERLVFARRMPLADHLARQKCADLFLDTLPVNAHTTASDALWAGLPVLTQIGETFAGRVAASVLTAIDLPELIASTPQAYEAMAIELVAHPERLATIKSKLERNRLTTPLFDTQRFTRHIEAAYTAMYQRYQSRLPPDHISMPA
jgi:protein O-GlcNAc transferase